MTKKQRDAYSEKLRERAGDSSIHDDGELIFKVTRAAIAAAIPGSQRKKHSQAMLDQMYADAFPSIIRSIR